MWRSLATSLSSTACRYSSQNAMIFRLAPVSSTSVFGMYDFEHPALNESATTAKRTVSLGFKNRIKDSADDNTPTSAAFPFLDPMWAGPQNLPRRLEPDKTSLG